MYVKREWLVCVSFLSARECESILLLIAFMWCVDVYSTTVWLGDNPYLFILYLICMTCITLCRKRDFRSLFSGPVNTILGELWSICAWSSFSYKTPRDDKGSTN